MAAKKTADLIPLAHPGIGVTGVSVAVEVFEGSDRESSQPTKPAERADTLAPEETGPDLTFAGVSAPSPDETTSETSITPQSRFGGVAISATVDCEGKTGVEMEALTAASVAGLTVYDMCKGVDRGMVMQGVRVVKKTGGKGGGWVWDETADEVKRIEEGTAEEGAREEGPADEFEKLVSMSDKDFAVKVHHYTRWRQVLWEAKQEREKAEEMKKTGEEVRKKGGDEALRAYIAKCEEEVQKGERGRVEQERLDMARQRRRKWFESSAEGTVLNSETREWMISSG